jgi:hypothetical protein
MELASRGWIIAWTGGCSFLSTATQEFPLPSSSSPLPSPFPFPRFESLNLPGLDLCLSPQDVASLKMPWTLIFKPQLKDISAPRFTPSPLGPRAQAALF